MTGSTGHLTPGGYGLKTQRITTFTTQSAMFFKRRWFVLFFVLEWEGEGGACLMVFVHDVWGGGVGGEDGVQFCLPYGLILNELFS